MSIRRSAPTIKAAVRALRGASLPRPLSRPCIAALNHGDAHVLKQRVATTLVPPSFPNPITARETFVSSHLHSHSILLMSRNSPTASHYRPPCSRPLCTTTSFVDGQQDFLEEMSIYKNEPALEDQLLHLVDVENCEFKWLKEVKKAKTKMEKARMDMEMAVENFDKAEIELENAKMDLGRAEFNYGKAELKMQLEAGKIGVERLKIDREKAEKGTENMKDMDKLCKEMDKLGNELEIVAEDYLKRKKKLND